MCSIGNPVAAYLEQVEMLIAANSNVNEKDKDGYGMLHFSTVPSEISALLKESGAL